MSHERATLCVLLEEFIEPDEIGLNTCLMIQNMLDVTGGGSHISPMKLVK